MRRHPRVAELPREHLKHAALPTSAAALAYQTRAERLIAVGQISWSGRVPSPIKADASPSPTIQRALCRWERQQASAAGSLTSISRIVAAEVFQSSPAASASSNAA